MVDDPGTQSKLAGSRVIVTGAGGQLGRYLRVALAKRGATVIGIGRGQAPGIDIVADIADEKAVRNAIRDAGPALVIHAAAYTDVDGCERNPSRAQAINAAGSGHVAAAADEVGARVIAVSTDFVFAGDGGAPYCEGDAVRPISEYGRSKLAGEEAIFAVDPQFAVVRTAWLYGGDGKHFPRTVLTVLRDRGSIDVVKDEIGSPTFAGDLSEAIADLTETTAGGVFHLVNQGAASRFSFAQEIARAAGFDAAQVRPISTPEFLAKFPLPARRPANSALANTRAAASGINLRQWQQASAAYIPMLAEELGISGSHQRPHEGARQA